MCKTSFILDFLIEHNLDYDSKKVDEIYEFIQKNANRKSGKTLSLTKDLWLFVSKEKICTIEDLEPAKIKDEIKIDKAARMFFMTKFLSWKNTKIPKCQSFRTPTSLRHMCRLMAKSIFAYAPACTGMLSSHLA